MSPCLRVGCLGCKIYKIVHEIYACLRPLTQQSTDADYGGSFSCKGCGCCSCWASSFCCVNCIGTSDSPAATAPTLDTPSSSTSSSVSSSPTRVVRGRFDRRPLLVVDGLGSSTTTYDSLSDCGLSFLRLGSTTVDDAVIEVVGTESEATGVAPGGGTAGSGCLRGRPGLRLGAAMTRVAAVGSGVSPSGPVFLVRGGKMRWGGSLDMRTSLTGSARSAVSLKLTMIVRAVPVVDGNIALGHGNPDRRKLLTDTVEERSSRF